MTSKLTPRQTRLVKAVRAHAAENYNHGWDIIVECYEDDDIARLVGKARTERSAINRAAVAVVLQREAAENAGWSEAQRELESGHDCGIAHHEHRGATDASQCAILRGGKDKPELEPDGSVVKCDYSWDGELLSATRTWPGKVGHAAIAVQWDGDEEPAEVYVPGWRGAVVQSANYCDHDAAKAAASGWGGCWTDGCRRPNCVPF